MPFELSINGDVDDVDTIDGLRAELAKLRQAQFSEVWLIAPQGWPTLTMLFNGNSAWLTFMRFEGDAGFSTRNPSYAGPRNAMLEFYLSNGQRDEYPASFNIGIDEAVKAMEYFFASQERAPWLAWHDDSSAD